GHHCRSGCSRTARRRRHCSVCRVFDAGCDGGAHRRGARADDDRGVTSMSTFAQSLYEAFGAEQVRSNVPLAPLTTFRVGGRAQWLVETRASDEIVVALKLAHAAQVPVTLLGGGSNVLVSDNGVNGLVIRTRGGQVCQIDGQQLRADAAVTIN